MTAMARVVRRGRNLGRLHASTLAVELGLAPFLVLSFVRA